MNKKNEKNTLIIFSTNLYLTTAVLFWTVLLSGFLVINLYHEGYEIKELALKTARENINKDNAIRFWSASHGGVYVPVDERTPPNPYLNHIPERDIETPSGIKLTLMNPAYMIRQVMEDFSEQYGVKGRITSLKPLRPENAPDEWEAKALNILEGGTKEIYEFTEIKGIPYLRMMMPLITEKACLKCHAFQGYKVGDIRGGVGVAIPLEPIRTFKQFEMKYIIFSHLIIWILGLFGMMLAAKRIKGDISALSLVEKRLKKSHDDLELKVEKRTADLISTNKYLEKEIIERKNIEEKLKTLSTTDDLTGLYNRRGFFNLANQQMHIAERAKKGLTLIYMDMNDLKDINDAQGHNIGDMAIIDFSDILKKYFRKADIVARVGGDEFISLLIDGSQTNQKIIVNNLQEKIDVFNESSKRPYSLSISVGVARYDSDFPVSLDDLVSKADTLMYVEKNKIKKNNKTPET